MITVGEYPYLECSSKGDRRFSAFFAMLDGRSIESRYQFEKIFEDGSEGLSIKEAKNKQKQGLRVVNHYFVSVLYGSLWDRYIEENPHLVLVLKQATGLSDIFGQKGHCCQALELWRIRNSKAYEHIHILGST